VPFGRPRTAPSNDSRASPSPVTTSGATPSVATTMSRNSAAFAASRVALVATIRTRSAPSRMISVS
jgi:hypothetical protein